MLRYLQIENFKSLKKVSMPIEKLNLFFGMNGMGKSSVIQSLLLLRQSYRGWTSRSLIGLRINGDLIKLGNSTDILCQEAEVDSIRFVTAFSGDRRTDVSFSNEMSSAQKGIMKITEPSAAEVPFADEEALFGEGFTYLAADHIEPRMEYDYSSWDMDGINPLGVRGEYAVPYLAFEGETFRVPPELCLPEGKTNHLYDQISAWMSRISPVIKIHATNEMPENRARLDISYEGQRLKSGIIKPVNVGFGIPYVLPLVLALLTAKKNGLLLIENPESHLHPKGQTVIAYLIAAVANRGTQIICESHSDHIINGIRVAVKKGQIHCEDLSVVYFDKDPDQLTRTTEIAVDRNGNLSEYPEGLLDEWGNLMAELF